MTARPLLDRLDPAEHLSPDDQATRREAQDRAVALHEHAARVARMPASTPGVCMNCGEPCRPVAVYCDPECRVDHEQRQAALARQGRAA